MKPKLFDSKLPECSAIFLNKLLEPGKVVEILQIADVCLDTIDLELAIYSYYSRSTMDL